MPANEFNKIFINLKRNQLPNEPKHVKIKRYLRYSSSSESSSSNETDESNISENGTLDSIDSFDSFDESEEETSQSISSVESDSEISNDIEPLISDAITTDENSLFNIFVSHIPKWGGSFFHNRKKFHLSNTCTVDYLLLGLWTISKMKENFLEDIPIIDITDSLKRLIEYIENNDWNNAKKTLIIEIMKLNLNEKHLSFFGTENEFFINYFSAYQSHLIKQQCSTFCYLNNSVYLNDSTSLYFVKINDQVTLTVFTNEKCNICNSNINSSIQLQHRANFLLIESSDTNIKIYELPSRLNINDRIFKFLCTTFNQNNHFKSIFKLNKKFYLVDDLDQTVIFLTELDGKNNNQKKQLFDSKYGIISTSTSLYYLE